MTQIQNTDLLLVNRGGVDYKIPAIDFKEGINSELFDPNQKPWKDHNGGIFHIVNSTGTMRLIGGPFKAWDVEGENERNIYQIDAGEELVFATTNVPSRLFNNCGSNNWDFGEYTDTSQVTSFDRFMMNSFKFEGTLGGNWDVSNVTYFRDMFNNCERFDQDISNWNTAKATDMRSMFQNNKVFNQDLSEWCVPNLYMEQIHYNMFSFGCTNWTEPKPNWGSCPRGENQ